MSFFLIFSFSFKWQTKEESLISTQKNMSIWEMVRNKTPFELFAFEAQFMHSFCVSATVTWAACPNFFWKSHTQTDLTPNSLKLSQLVSQSSMNHRVTGQPPVLFHMSKCWSCPWINYYTTNTWCHKWPNTKVVCLLVSGSLTGYYLRQSQPPMEVDPFWNWDLQGFHVCLSVMSWIVWGASLHSLILLVASPWFTYEFVLVFNSKRSDLLWL